MEDIIFNWVDIRACELDLVFLILLGNVPFMHYYNGDW